jgi:predicted DNA-binding transcriptional regulator YafY
VRASRLVALLLLLQHRGQVTAAELADELEVSVRTIYRDLEALSAAGVPVYAEAGRNGGARLVDGYRTRLTGLTAKEAEALFAAGVPGAVGDLGLGTVLGAAQLKLLAALPKDLADRATMARQRFHYDAPGWFKAARNEPHLIALSGAVWDDRRVEVEYRHPGSDETATRVLDPLGLVNKAGIWYLVARRDDELRTYRVSRMQSVKSLDEQFVRDSDFDLSVYWNSSVANYESQMPPNEVVVRVADDAYSELQWIVGGYGRALKKERKLDDGRHECVLAFEHLDDAYYGVLRLGADVEVLEPDSLRARLAETARALSSLYSD